MSINLQYKVFVPILLIFFSATWFFANDSYHISRDEMWYTNYSTNWNDSETQDIRHITELDIHQAGLAPVFRLMQRLSVSGFGKNLYGLRALNLIFGIFMVISVAFFMYKYQLSIIWVGLFCVLVLFDPAISKHLHQIRPDWIMESCLVMMSASVFLYIKEEKLLFLYSGGIIGGIASGVYWNGLAAVAGFLVVLAAMVLRKDLSLISCVKVVIVCCVSLVLFWVTPLLMYLPETYALFSIDGAQTSRLASGNVLTGYLSNFIGMFKPLFVLGKYQLMLGSLTAMAILITFFHFLFSKVRKTNQIMLYGWLWIIVFLMVVALRGGGLRHIYFILPFFYLIFATAFGFLYSVYNKKWVVRLFTAYLILFCLLITIKMPLNWIARYGKWDAYIAYSEDLSSLLKDNKDGRVLTTFDASWALENYPKLFMEVASFKRPETYNQTKQLFEKYNVKYVLVDETSRLRMSRPDELRIGKDWYRYWDKLLQNDYRLIGIVYNKYYRPNKGLPPGDPKGFKTEVWKLVEQI